MTNPIGIMGPIDGVLCAANDSTLDGFFCTVRSVGNLVTARFYWKRGIESRSFEVVMRDGSEINFGAFERGVREIVKEG